MFRPRFTKPKPSTNSNKVSSRTADCPAPFINRSGPKVRPSNCGYQVPVGVEPRTTSVGTSNDWKKLPDGRWILVLGRLTGHGIGPGYTHLAQLPPVLAVRNSRASVMCGYLETMLKNINQAFAEDLTPEAFLPLFISRAFFEKVMTVEHSLCRSRTRFSCTAVGQPIVSNLWTRRARPLGILPYCGRGTCQALPETL